MLFKQRIVHHPHLCRSFRSHLVHPMSITSSSSSIFDILDAYRYSILCASFRSHLGTAPRRAASRRTSPQTYRVHVVERATHVCPWTAAYRWAKTCVCVCHFLLFAGLFASSMKVAQVFARKTDPNPRQECGQGTPFANDAFERPVCPRVSLA